VGFAKRVIRVEIAGPEEDVNGEKIQGNAGRWCWRQECLVKERGEGYRKQVDYVVTRARVGEGTVRYSTRFHLSHVESAVASEADTHGHTRGVIVERVLLVYAVRNQCISICIKDLSDFNVENFECYRNNLERVDLLALRTSRNVLHVIECTREVCCNSQWFK
jgi:hypothetical protein